MEEQKNSLLERIKALKDRLRISEAANEAKDEKIEELQKKVAEISESNVKLKADYERLKIARAYAWDEKSKHEATRRINNILLEIDRCLAQLKQDVNL